MNLKIKSILVIGCILCTLVSGCSPQKQESTDLKPTVISEKSSESSVPEEEAVSCETELTPQEEVAEPNKTEIEKNVIVPNDTAKEICDTQEPKNEISDENISEKTDVLSYTEEITETESEDINEYAESNNINFLSHEKKALESVLDEKMWSDDVEQLILELYDQIDLCFSIREGYNPEDKDEHLANYISTIESIVQIELNPNDIVLARNNWNARADYYNNMIVLKFPNICDLRHEVSHLEQGNFRIGSEGVDLGFVFEEGRASYIEGEGFKNTVHLDNISFNININGNTEVIIDGVSGSYPAFEVIYKNLMALDIDMEALRRKNLPLDNIVSEIEIRLNEIYGNNLGSDYIACLNEYIEFFDNAGVLKPIFEENPEAFYSVKSKLDELNNLMQTIRSQINCKTEGGVIDD